MKRHPILSLWLAGSLSAFTTSVFAETETQNNDSEPLGPIVVTATRSPVTEDQVASAVTVIRREDIENSGKTRVIELLRSVPGLSVIQQGGAGQFSSIFMRGAESNHVLVMIDGIELNNPGNPNDEVDFATLQVENIERIEVVRGPQSTLYGSDAIGGVIHIITRQDSGSDAYLTVGEFNTVNAGFGLRSSGNIHSFSLSAGYLDTDGTSAANPERGVEDEPDAHRNETVSLRWGIQATDNLNFSISTRLQGTESDFDEFHSAFPAPSDFVAHDPDSALETEQSFSKIQTDWSSSDGKWMQRFAIGHSTHKRDVENGPLGANTCIRTDVIRGQKTKVDWQHTVKPASSNTLVFGAEMERDEIDADKNSCFGPSNVSESVSNSAFYLQDQIYFTDNLSTVLGIRSDNHDEFGTANTWRVAPLWRIPATGTTLKATYGTGFKAPSLSNLHDSFGNPDLEPEESRGWDAGIEQSFGFATFGITYFRNDFRNLINFDLATFSLGNITRAETKGYEFTLGLAPTDSVDIQLSYTSTDAIDVDTEEDLLRRPENEVSLDINWQVIPRLRIGLAGREVGERLDFFGFSHNPVNGRGTLESYTVVDLNADIYLSASWTLNMRIDNLNDEEYEESVGYAAPGRAGYLGLRWQGQ